MKSNQKKRRNSKKYKKKIFKMRKTISKRKMPLKAQNGGNRWIIQYQTVKRKSLSKKRREILRIEKKQLLKLIRINKLQQKVKFQLHLHNIIIQSKRTLNLQIVNNNPRRLAASILIKKSMTTQNKKKLHCFY